MTFCRGVRAQQEQDNKGFISYFSVGLLQAIFDPLLPPKEIETGPHGPSAKKKKKGISMPFLHAVVSIARIQYGLSQSPFGVIKLFLYKCIVVYELLIVFLPTIFIVDPLERI